MLKSTKPSFQEPIPPNSLFARLPSEVKHWAESLPWKERRYVLSLCHILCGSSPETKAEFLDQYTADGLASKLLEDIDTLERIKNYLSWFRIETVLNESFLRSYIRQFYQHSAQDVRSQPDDYFESALRLALSPKDKDRVFNYVLGFELLKLMFNMSWLQHERLARLQRNSDDFIKNYIKPIQTTHKLNGIVIPKDEHIFFAKREYFIKKPKLSISKLTPLIIATFTTEQVVDCGFSVTRHIRSLEFDYDYVFNPSEPESIFPWAM